jgi:hypothetical protein
MNVPLTQFTQGYLARLDRRTDRLAAGSRMPWPARGALSPSSGKRLGTARWLGGRDGQRAVERRPDKSSDLSMRGNLRRMARRPIYISLHKIYEISCAIFTTQTYSDRRD